MKKPSKTLQAEWDKKLKESGFNDIEQRYGDVYYLKQYDAHYFQSRYSPDRFTANETYYRDARHRMWTFQFRDKHDKIVWWLHANGLSNSEIGKILKFSKNKIQTDVVRLKREMLGLN